MADRYLAELFTPEVLRAQTEAYGAAADPGAGPPPMLDALGPAEAEFIAARDSFYLASVSSSGWPYVQHRGGPRGFLRVESPTTLAFDDYRGNRQLLSTGNVAGDDRVSLFLMDYVGRRRLKILGHARCEPYVEVPGATPPATARPERRWIIEAVSFDWNCPKWITPRYSPEEVEAYVAPLRAEIERLREAARSGEKGAN